MNNNNKRENISDKKEGFFKKLAAYASFYLDNIKNSILKTFSSKKKKEKDRSFSRRVYSLLPDEDKKLEDKRRRYKKSGRRRATDVSYNRDRSKFSLWYKKTAFIIGNIRISRFGVASIIFIMLALASGTIVLASNIDTQSEIQNIAETELSYNSKKIFILYNDETIEVQTESKTVGDVLKENSIVLKDDEFVSYALERNVYSKMQIEIKKAFTVILRNVDEEQTLSVNGSTVKSALEEAGIAYDDDDRITPELETSLSHDMEISFDKIDIENVIEEMAVEYETEYRDEPTVLKGMYADGQKGKDGVVRYSYEVTYLNGIEESRDIVSQEIIKESVPKIILNGTGLKRAGSDTAGGGDDYSAVKVSNPNEQATNPSIPSGPGSHIESITAHVTAYTHTGSKTATGTWPRSTRTLANPGSIAVVPNTFAYGSLLYIPGYGYAIAEDTGGFRHDSNRWNQIDVFMNTYDECITWGRKRTWTVYVLRYGH